MFVKQLKSDGVTDDIWEKPVVFVDVHTSITAISGRGFVGTPTSLIYYFDIHSLEYPEYPGCTYQQVNDKACQGGQPPIAVDFAALKVPAAHKNNVAA